ncbi:hypothetical protein Tco_1549587 [Tanacetum coccineum]
MFRCVEKFGGVIDWYQELQIIMANLPPNHNEFALAVEAAPNNMNGWIKEEEDLEMEEEEDPEMEEEEEEMDVDADEEWDGPE